MFHQSGQMLFQSTPPARRATRRTAAACRSKSGFNPRPPRGGRPEGRVQVVGVDGVSIHAPRAEGDPFPVRSRSARDCFNPRPPRGGRLLMVFYRRVTREFQSTPPARRATHDFVDRLHEGQVSIHAPRAEGDRLAPRITSLLIWFQSTPPARRATSAGCCCPPARCRFNPRPPRGGRRGRRRWPRRPPRGFNPRPPRGGRLDARCIAQIAQQFQSTPPARRATCGWARPSSRTRCFNPRPPRGGRPAGTAFREIALAVSIHAPRAEGDSRQPQGSDSLRTFQSTPPARRATPTSHRATAGRKFQSTPPARRATRRLQPVPFQ